jgi:hypothetical protein
MKMIELKKFGWMIRKELISLKRHPARLVSILAFPIIMILLFWWIIAWILGLMFPGKEFFPIKKIWDSASRWAKEKLNVDLGSAAFAAGIILLLTAIFGGGSSKKD